MNTQRIGWRGAMAVVMLLAAVSLAKEMTVKDVIELKRMSFSDQDVIAEITKTDSKFNLTEQDVAALKEAGAGEQLIRAMRNPPRKVSVADVAQMLKDGKGAEAILDALLASPEKPKATIAEIRDLQEKRAPMSVMLALKGAPLSAADLKLVAEGKPAAGVYGKLAELLGFQQQQQLSAADAKSLLDAGVPAAVVTKLKEAGEGQARKETKPEKKPEPEKKPAPAEEADEQHPAEFIGEWEGSAQGALGGESPVTLTLRANGGYTLRMGLVGQAGKWSVNKEAGNFLMQPSPGMPETESYTMDETKTRLTIEATTGKMVLRKKQR